MRCIHLQVRQLKNRLKRLITRVDTVRDVLDRLLDDDGDMRDMNLTAKARTGPS
jgi:magnesium transporter